MIAPADQIPTATLEQSVIVKAQRVRKLRVLQSSAVYGVGIALFSIFGWLGNFQIDPWLLALLSSSSLVIALVFYGLVASGINLRTRDPSLTLAQMIAATVWVYIPFYFLPAIRTEILMGYLSVFFFGCFRLRRHQFLLITALAVTGYFGIIGLDTVFETTRTTLKQDLARLAILTAELLILSFLGGYIFDIRQQLREQHKSLQKAHEIISRQAIFDSLTGLHNRRFLMAALQREEARARRSSSQFCLIMCDLDHFKSINDRFGHLTGDAVLRSASEIMMAQLRAADWLAHVGDELVARYGGEEFAILLPDCDLASGERCAERLRQALATATIPELPANHQVTGSFGVTQYRIGEQLRDLIARADSALYEAKHAGRDRVVTLQ